MSFRERMATNDLRACLVLYDARKAENATARERMQSNTELCAHLLAEAQRRGESAIDWTVYFSQLLVL